MRHLFKILVMAFVTMFAFSTVMNAQLGNLVNKAKKAVGGTPGKIEVVSSGKTWGEFYPRENKFVRIKDGKIQYTRTLLANGDIMTEENERWGRTDEQGQMYCAKNKRRVKYDPVTMWVYDNSKVVGKLTAAKDYDGRDILSFTRYGFNLCDGLVGKEKDLKDLDHRLLVWLFYCFLKPSEGEKDEEGERYHQKILENQRRLDKGHTAENRFSEKIEGMIIAAVEKDNGLMHNGVRGRLLDVQTTSSEWNVVKDKDQLGREVIVARNTYAWVTVRFEKYYLYRKYLISQDYKMGDPLKDEAFGIVYARRVGGDDLNPVYE